MISVAYKYRRGSMELKSKQIAAFLTFDNNRNGIHACRNDIVQEIIPCRDGDQKPHHCRFGFEPFIDGLSNVAVRALLLFLFRRVIDMVKQKVHLDRA